MKIPTYGNIEAYEAEIKELKAVIEGLRSYNAAPAAIIEGIDWLEEDNCHTAANAIRALFMENERLRGDASKFRGQGMACAAAYVSMQN